MVIVLAWTWVLLVNFLNLAIIWSLSCYNHRDAGNVFGKSSKVNGIITRLSYILEHDIRPNATESRWDKAVIDFCSQQPSDIFFFVVHFIWSSRMLGQLSEARTLLVTMWSCPVREARERTIEERNDNVLLAGLMPYDCPIFTATLVLPKSIMAILLWYVGSELLALTRDLSHLLLKAVTLYYVSVIEMEIFSNFLSHSKKEWIMAAQMVQVRGPCCRMAVSWPGEVLKLLSAISLVWGARFMFATETEVRTLCFRCVRICTNECSQAFGYCRNLPSWPYNYKGPT